MARDMKLFADGDGSTYHIHASENNSTLHISLLDETFTKPAGRYVRVMPSRFHEVPALMKWNGHYWLFSSDCTGWAPDTASLSSAPSIWEPWDEHGNPCLGPRRTDRKLGLRADADKSGQFAVLAKAWAASPFRGVDALRD